MAAGGAAPASAKPAPITLNPQKGPAPARPAPPPVPAEQALLALPSPGLPPADFELGPLADLLAASRPEREGLNAAGRFLDGLAKGKVPEEELLPERREELARSLRYYLDRRLLPSSHRLGQYSAEDGGARVKVRLLSKAGESRGELYLSRQEGRWYVSDVQAGFLQLGEPRPQRQGKFVPAEVQ